MFFFARFTCVCQVVKRLNEIDAYGAEARAASILSGLSFDASMQVWRCAVVLYFTHAPFAAPPDQDV